MTSTPWTAKAKGVAAALKAEHQAGLRGDDSPVQPVWPSPSEQLAALKKLFRAPAPETPSDDTAEAEAQQVAEAIRGVDWSAVKAAAAERTSDVTRTMRAMADHVDWAKVQPVAAQVSSALIAAVASGRIPVGGQLGPIVARAITDQNNLGQRVARNLEQARTEVPPGFREIIDTTARD